MANAPFHVFAKGLVALGAKLENLPSDALKTALFTDAATHPAGVLATAEFVADIVTAGGTELTNTATGYTTGGVALPSATWAATVANSWPTTYAISTAYSVGAIVKPSGGNTFLYQCVVAGTTSGTAPTWLTVIGGTTTDGGGVVWLNIGTAVTVLGGGNIVYTQSGATAITAQYGLLYDSTPGSYATDPIIGYWDFGGTLTASGGGTLTIAIPSSGILALGSS